MTRKQAWELYIAAFNEIKRCAGVKDIPFPNGIGGNVVNVILDKAKEIGL